jgi:1-acyl-sn-glycerol-3-phosphate acyltransferase
MLYYFSRWLLRILLRIFGGISVEGLEKFPESGGVILAPNHISYLDPPAVGLYIPRQVHFMAKEELFKVPLLGAWMHRVGAFPVKRGAPDRKAIKHALELLKQGKVVCIFPEGTRSENGELQDPELGIGLIALKSRVPVVPAFIKGTDKVLPRHARCLYRHPIKIVYGEPMTFPDLYDVEVSRPAMQEVGRRIIEAIENLANRQNTGVKS